MPKGTPVTFYQLKRQILERKFKDIMPSYYDRAARIRPNLPEYGDETLQDKLEQVTIKIAMLKLLVDDAKSKQELHQMRKSMDYNLAVKRFIKREQRKRERRLQEQIQANEVVEIVEIDDAGEQSPPNTEDRKPTREEFEEMEQEDLRQIGLDLPTSNIHVDQLNVVIVPDLDMEFTDDALIFDPMIQVNNVQTIYDRDHHDMHFLDVLFSVDENDYVPLNPLSSTSEKAVTEDVISSINALPISVSVNEETPEEPVNRGNLYQDEMVDYMLAFDVRTGEPFSANKSGEQLFIGSDGNFYGINAYDVARVLKVKNKKYVCFGANNLDLAHERIYLSCIV